MSSGDAPLRKHAAYPPHGLADPLLVLDEREADEAFPVCAEAAARTNSDVPFAQEPECECLRGLVGRNARPDEHRRLWARHLPADPGEAVAQGIAAALIDLRYLR